MLSPRTMMLLLLLSLAAGTSASAGLNLVLYPNAAWGGEATANKTVAKLDDTTLEFAGSAPFSVEITGTLTPPADLVGDGKQMQLSCEILNGAGFLWLDDHVVCQGGHDPTQWGQYKSDALVLPWMVAPGIPLGGSVTKPLFLRATFAHLDRADMRGKPSFTLKWGALPPIPPPGPPSPPYPPPTYVGCYKDDVGKLCNRSSGICPRDLPFNAGDLKGGVGKNTDSPSACAQECQTKMGGRTPKYIGLQDGDNCFCGNSYGQYGNATNCNMPCPAPGQKIMCGGSGANSVYDTHAPAPPPVPPPPPAAPVPASVYTTAVPHTQSQRLLMQRNLLHGRWGTFAKGSYAAHALLPHGVLISFGMCGADGSCDQNADKDMQNNDLVRVGAHAYDHSYTQLYFQGRSKCNVSIETSQIDGEQGGDLVALITPVSGCAAAAAMSVMQMTDNLTDMCAAWNRYGNVTTDKGVSMTGTPHGKGLDPIQAWAAGTTFAGKANPPSTSPNYLLRALSKPVSFSTGKQRTVAEVGTIISSARSKELATYAKYGELAAAKEMSQVGMMWNVLYSLEIPGTFAPVSRGWGQPWVIFDWDNIFGAYQFSLDAKELAYSQLTAVIKTKTAHGMVPNFWQPNSISYDRTEPPIGSKVLFETYQRWQEAWFVELLFDDCYDWTQWFFRRRQDAPLGLIVLGADAIADTTDTPNMQAARYESGLDNSPMYDGEFYSFNETLQSGHMHLYDVGMASMLAMELQSLANLSLAAFNPPRTAQHASIMKQLKGLQALIQKHHWNEDIGIFANKFSAEYTGQCNASAIVTGTNCSSGDCCKDGWYNRIAPTSFYPMQSGIATDAQATTMMEKWLMNKDRFCIAPEGDSAGNTAGCHWGLPSISASDPAFPPLGYWRGFVWGPMVQLTYWGLQQYPHVPAVVKGRKALAKQMTAMGMNQWNMHHHVCENYNPGFTTQNKGSDCTGDHFYHWGGLTGFISILEAGYYENPVV